MAKCNGRGRRDCQIELLTIFGSFIIQSWVSFARSGHSLGKDRRSGGTVCHHVPRLLAGSGSARAPRAYLLERRRRRCLAHPVVMYTRSGNSPPPCPIGPRGHRSSPPRPSRRRRRRAAFLRESGSRISHLPSSWPRFTAATGGDPCHSHKNSLARSLSRTMKNRYCIEREGDRRVQWDFSPANCISCRVCGQSAPEPSMAGTDYHPLSLFFGPVCCLPWSVFNARHSQSPAAWLAFGISLGHRPTQIGSKLQPLLALGATAATVQADL